jgi:hypothetical protein
LLPRRPVTPWRPLRCPSRPAPPRCWRRARRRTGSRQRTARGGRCQTAALRARYPTSLYTHNTRIHTHTTRDKVTPILLAREMSFSERGRRRGGERGEGAAHSPSTSPPLACAVQGATSGGVRAAATRRRAKQPSACQQHRRLQHRTHLPLALRLMQPQSDDARPS